MLSVFPADGIGPGRLHTAVVTRNPKPFADVAPLTGMASERVPVRERTVDEPTAPLKRCGKFGRAEKPSVVPLSKVQLVAPQELGGPLHFTYPALQVTSHPAAPQTAEPADGGGW
jgi:hypothetical protein